MRISNLLDKPETTLFHVGEGEEEGYYFVFVTAKIENPTDEEWSLGKERLKAGMRQISSNRMKYHFVLDVTAMKRVTFQQAWDIHEVLVSDKDLILNFLQSTAIICNSPVIRNIANAITNIIPVVKPLRFFEKHSENDLAIVLQFSREARKARDKNAI